MRTIPLMVMIIASAMLASPHVYGQVAGKGPIGTPATGGKPSGPAVGSGDRTLIPPAQPGIAPAGNALSDLAGGGYADPKYVPPKTKSKTSTPRRVFHAHRARAWRRFGRYRVNPFFPYRYCYCYCDY